MSTIDEGHRADRSEFYAAQYAQFESEVTSDIRREVYGEDIGQQGWRSFDEQTLIANLILESLLPTCLTSPAAPAVLLSRSSIRRAVG